jgi:diaminohydroxyphosphoribosylaminopyrimidine deaminase/5-amino-6-(5-phosphoribosylamino)uracil reductase
MMPMASPRELEAMERALALAALGLGTVAPNPVVGCVVLDSGGEIVGEGWHQRAGEPHAEALALREAGSRAVGGTAVVTLEPCAHTGRTGPCVEALIEAGITRVVYAVDDPSPEADGGAERLNAAGLDVEGGVLSAQAAHVNRAWLTSVRKGRPFVTLKLATSLDGQVAAADGSSRWITGPKSRADAHRLRALSDAVLVGTGTVLADDPALTVRDVEGDLAGRTPLRVVLGRTAIPAGARVADDSAPTLHLPTHDLSEAMTTVHEAGVRSVLVEGGPTIAGALLKAGLVDEVVAYIAPVLIGDGKNALAGLTLATIADALRLQEVQVSVLGDDVRIVGRIGEPAGKAD